VSLRARLTCGVVAVLSTVGCQADGTGTLRARWASVDTTIGTGELTMPVTATWCAPRGRLTLLGVSGDTGVGILIRTVTLAPGRFDVSDTAAAPSPGAAIAVRVAQQTNLFALSGDSGAVAITSVQGGRVAGRFVAWFSRPDAEPVLLMGDFKGARVAADGRNCKFVAPPAPSSAPAPDSGVI
jgi:hypothetical protein